MKRDGLAKDSLYTRGFSRYPVAGFDAWKIEGLEGLP